MVEQQHVNVLEGEQEQPIIQKAQVIQEQQVKQPDANPEPQQEEQEKEEHASGRLVACNG